MTEIELLRSAYVSIPEPDEQTVAEARSALDRAIAARSRAPARRRPRRLMRLSFAIAVGVGTLLAGVFTLVLPRGHVLTGEEIAAAAYRALTTPRGVIRHVVVTGSSGNRVVYRAEMWVAGSPPYSTLTRTPGGETELTRCGRVTYDPARNLVTVVEEPRNPLWFFRHDRDDPAREFLLGAGGYISPKRFGPLRYQGQTTVHGIPAYSLVRRDRAGQGASVVYVVRRDNYYPLRVEEHFKDQPPFVDTFSDFEEIPRTDETEHLLHVGPHPEAFLLRTSVTNYYRVPECTGFATFPLLTGRKTG